MNSTFTPDVGATVHCREGSNNGAIFGDRIPHLSQGFGAQSSKSVILPCSPAPTDLGEPALLPILAREKQMLLFTVHRGSGDPGTV